LIPTNVEPAALEPLPLEIPLKAHSYDGVRYLPGTLVSFLLHTAVLFAVLCLPVLPTMGRDLKQSVLLVDLYVSGGDQLGTGDAASGGGGGPQGNNSVEPQTQQASAEQTKELLYSKNINKKKLIPKIVNPPAEKMNEVNQPSDSSVGAEAGVGSDGSGQETGLGFGNGKGSGIGEGNGKGGNASYEGLLARWLEKHKRYPHQARVQHIEGEGSVKIYIDRTGKVLDFRIEKSTGSTILDEGIGKIIKNANPFPPFPLDYPAEELEFLVPIRFSLRQ
jgi:periplasmic protein TonB